MGHFSFASLNPFKVQKDSRLLEEVSDWREREAKIEVKFTGDAEGGLVTQCLCFESSRMFQAAQSRLRQTGSSHSNMGRGSAHFSYRLLAQKLPLMETWRKIRSAPPGRLSRAITVALLQL